MNWYTKIMIRVVINTTLISNSILHLFFYL